jgi:nucleotide-binding universal stress UspA family protein
MFERVLVALDHSAASSAIFQEALALAQAIDAQMMLLHVLSPFDEAFPNPVFPGADSTYPTIHTEAIQHYLQEWETYEREGLEMLQRYANQASAVGVAVDFTHQTGNPGRVICQMARHWSADLILVGRRGHTGLSELLLGSVSNYVVHHAPCSVLTIQGQHLQQGTDSMKQSAIVH